VKKVGYKWGTYKNEIIMMHWKLLQGKLLSHKQKAKLL